MSITKTIPAEQAAPRRTLSTKARRIRTIVRGIFWVAAGLIITGFAQVFERALVGSTRDLVIVLSIIALLWIVAYQLTKRR